jgi:hypothetical protein
VRVGWVVSVKELKLLLAGQRLHDKMGQEEEQLGIFFAEEGRSEAELGLG